MTANYKIENNSHISHLHKVLMICNYHSINTYTETPIIDIKNYNFNTCIIGIWKIKQLKNK